MRILLPIAALAALAAPAAAETRQSGESFQVRINFSDIDLATAEGRATLEARIEARLREACTIDLPATYTHGQEIFDETCYADARAEAMAQVERFSAAEKRGGREVAAN